MYSTDNEYQAGVAEVILAPMPEKSATRSEPTVNTTTLIATAIPAAIRPYSMAVAPFWHLTKASFLASIRENILPSLGWFIYKSNLWPYTFSVTLSRLKYSKKSMFKPLTFTFYDIDKMLSNLQGMLARHDTL